MKVLPQGSGIQARAAREFGKGPPAIRLPENCSQNEAARTGKQRFEQVQFRHRFDQRAVPFNPEPPILRARFVVYPLYDWSIAMKRLLAALALSVFAASGADSSGNWKATAEGPNGTMERTFTFKQDGSKVTGKTVS